jgi:hypothetical protein
MSARLAAGWGMVIAAIAIPVAVVLVTVLRPPAPVQSPPALVFGGAYVAGIALGVIYYAARGRPDRERDGDRFGESFGLVIGIVGLVLIAVNLVPFVGGWDTRLVLLMFGMGLALPGLPDTVKRLIEESRSATS